jgi:hypothetical protein
LSEAGKPQSNGMIERANATIKELIQKSIELDQNFDWLKQLDKLMNNINNSQHRITGLTPNQIQQAYENDDTIILDKAYDTELEKQKVTYLNKYSKLDIELDYINQAIKHEKHGVIKYIRLKKYSNHRKVTVYMNIN